jgi:hypothetical protein
MSAVAGLRGTGDWATDERPKNFREMILFRNPNGTAPLFALMGKVGEESVNDPEFSWWDEPNDLVRLQVNGALLVGATTFVVDSADPTAATPSAHWGVAKHLKAGDLLLVEDSTLDSGFTNEIVMVTAVASDTSFTVTRGVSGTTAAAIADDAYLLKIGSAYSEGSTAPDATSRNPIKFYNYCQIFKNAYELTRTASKTKTRTGDPKANDKKRKIWDHSRDIELSLMFGQRYETTGSNGKPLRFMGGLREFIPSSNVTIFDGSTSLTDYLNASYGVFDYDSPAGNERILFCGNNYLNQLNLLVRANSEVQFQGTIKAYGMELKQFSMPQGTFYLKTHPLMNRHSQFRSSAFIIDASALRWRYITDTMFEDNIQTPGQDSQKGQWLTEGGLEVRHAGMTLGYHGGFTGIA